MAYTLPLGTQEERSTPPLIGRQIGRIQTIFAIFEEYANIIMMHTKRKVIWFYTLQT